MMSVIFFIVMLNIAVLKVVAPLTTHFCEALPTSIVLASIFKDKDSS